VERVHAIDSIAARVTTGDRTEMHEPAICLGESATTRDARDRGALAVADGDRAQLGIRWMEHWLGLPGYELTWTATRLLD
jgi:hypothetical protein